MAREGFHNRMRELERDVLHMGEMVIEAVQRSVAALADLDARAAKKIVDDDAKINRFRWSLEDKCVDLIALQQPVASDLREIIATLSIVRDLERIGDYAEGIGKIVLLHGDQPLVRPLVYLPAMTEKTLSMLRRSLEAFTHRDAEKAQQICLEDDEVDRLYDQSYRDLINRMVENPSVITRATYLMWSSHNIERIADRATNIAESVVYLVTGTPGELNVSRY
ncbi:MAG TPA: phosphate signaling complex protein PhoU [Sedimentisphaerales bacterium]|nr:phosphate signaling complex protein PhoU [Sedimentisphaerales bacterium]HRS13020.1 phosphate signaling complex protein PhoU [Sedimentisphaerales bacterium]HRV49633.1 phosphate signaling complex protein PhoU [Sedimentisphaerales bacterium]